MILEEILMIIIVPTLGAFVLLLLYRRYQLQVQARLKRIETFDHLIDKFSSAKELIDLMETEVGRQLLEERQPGGLDPLASVRRFAQSGIILLVLGGAFLLNAWRLRSFTDLNYVNQAIGLNNWGTIFIACGAALLMIAVVSHFLARRRN